MNIETGVAAATVADRLPRPQNLRAELQRAGSVAEWLRRQPVTEPLHSYPSAVRAVGWDEALYPPAMRRLAGSPPALFVVGDSAPLPLPSECVALIGARRCSELGRHVARELAYELAREGVVVVSGLALGIDGAAHGGALDAGGRTLAVLASAVDHPTPPRHAALSEEIASRGGWLVSERPPRAPVRPRDFPKRNRLVAALCSVVVVVEAGVRSGTLSTVSWALGLGSVEVGAVPGSIVSPASRGPNALLAAGAHVVTGAQDVLSLLGRQARRASDAGPGLDADERSVIDGLPSGVGTLDRWVRAAGLPSTLGRQAVSRLVARGVLRPLPGGRFARGL